MYRLTNHFLAIFGNKLIIFIKFDHETNKAAQNFAMIRSVIDTTIKNSCNVVQALIAIAKFGNQIVTD